MTSNDNINDTNDNEERNNEVDRQVNIFNFRGNNSIAFLSEDNNGNEVEFRINIEHMVNQVTPAIINNVLDFRGNNSPLLREDNTLPMENLDDFMLTDTEYKEEKINNDLSHLTTHYLKSEDVHPIPTIPHSLSTDYEDQERVLNDVIP